MRFLTRSLMGLFLTALTIGLIAFAAFLVRGAVETRMAQESRAMPARERVYSVRVVGLAPDAVAPVLEAFGEVRSRRELEIRMKVGGSVVALGAQFEDGGVVRAGDMLLEVDDTDLKDALALAEASVSEAQAEADDARAAELIARDDLAAAEKQHALRVAALERQNNLLERRVGTESTVETAALAESAAEQAVLAKRGSLRTATARVAQAATSLERVIIALEEAQRRLNEAHVTADFSGTLADVTAAQGRLVTANEQVATLVDPDRLEVSFRLSTAQYARLLDENGDLIRADVAAKLAVAGVDLIAPGAIARESAAVGDGQTGRLIYATLDGARGFRPGDFVSVEIREPVLDGVALVPASAVSSAATVLVLGEEDRLVEHPIEVLRRQGNEVLVRVGALAGREIVAERSPTLGAGIRIRPIRDADTVTPEAANTAPAGADLIELDAARRARLIAAIERAPIPDDAKERILTQLAEPMVPARMVERIESRMGG
ncbi:MAG: efflux RND transporter periplasmic adaptor subunit [Maritimibacter sp.]